MNSEQEGIQTIRVNRTTLNRIIIKFGGMKNSPQTVTRIVDARGICTFCWKNIMCDKKHWERKCSIETLLNNKEKFNPVTVNKTNLKKFMETINTILRWGEILYTEYSSSAACHVCPLYGKCKRGKGCSQNIRRFLQEGVRE